MCAECIVLYELYAPLSSEFMHAPVCGECSCMCQLYASVCVEYSRTLLNNPVHAEYSGMWWMLQCMLIVWGFVDQIDLMDMSQNPDGDYSHIGLYTDHWTKFITLFPMMGCSPEHVAYGLASSVFPYYGPPHFLHSSDGKEFAEEVIRLSMEKWKGRLTFLCRNNFPSSLYVKPERSALVCMCARTHPHTISSPPRLFLANTE